MTEPDASAPAASTPYRGDFMLMPPMLPTFGSPSRIQQAPGDFLVTRRPTAVSDPQLVHSVDMQVTGRMRRRARRRIRQDAPELAHLIAPDDLDEEHVEESSGSSLPPAPRPRTLTATPRTSKKSASAPAPAALPSRDAVRRRVASPAPDSPPRSIPAAEAAELPPAPDMPSSTFPGLGETTVVRRRGGGPTVVPGRVLASTTETPEGDKPTESASGPDDSGPDTSAPGSRPSAVQAPPAAPSPGPVLAAPAPSDRTPAAPIPSVASDPLPAAPGFDPITDETASSAQTTIPTTSAPPLIRRRSRGHVSLPSLLDDDDAGDDRGSTPPSPAAVEPMTPSSSEPAHRAQAPSPAVDLPDLIHREIPDSAPATSTPSAIAASAGGSHEHPTPHRVTQQPRAGTASSLSAGPSPSAPPAPGTDGPSTPLDSTRTTPMGTESPSVEAAPTDAASLVKPLARDTAQQLTQQPPSAGAGEWSAPVLGARPTPRDDTPTSATPTNAAPTPTEAEIAELIHRADASPTTAGSSPTDAASLVEPMARDTAQQLTQQPQTPRAASSSPLSTDEPSAPLLGARPTPRDDAPASAAPTSAALTTAEAEIAELIHRADTSPTTAGNSPTDAASVGGQIARETPHQLTQQPRTHRAASPSPLSTDEPSAPLLGARTTPRDDAPASAAPTRTEAEIAELIHRADTSPTTATSSPTDAASVGGQITLETPHQLTQQPQARSAAPEPSTAPSGHSTPPPAPVRPVLSGRTGIQRRARSKAPGGSSLSQTTPSGLAGISGTPEPRSVGPRRVQVPQRVKQALLATGSQPPSHVTVHEGADAASQADAVNAEAFTRDGQVYLAGDAPLSSERGQQLLAHELTHVMQQGSRSSTMPGEHTHEGTSLEEAALAVEQAMITGRHETVAPVVTPRAPKAPDQPELHHRPTAPTQAEPSTWVGAPSRGSSAPPSSTSPTPSTSSSPVQFSVDTSIQRRERDLGSSALSSGLGGMGRAAMGGLQNSLLSSFEQEMSGPSGPKKDKDSRFKQLERQAAQLYPYIRSRLRAELIRELERRGRISQEWR